MEEKRIVTHHSAAIRGTAVQYDAVVENFIFTAGDGVQEASMVTHTYLRTDAENPAARPVIFAYNGGPGGCSIYVHMAMLAPKRMQMGDIDTLLDDNHLALEDNPDSPLDVCDIVIMDAVSTGFSRLLAEDRAANYYGSMADADAFAAVIRRWLARYDRNASANYLVGVTYGSFRNVLLAKPLLDERCSGSYGLRPAGIVMMGTASDYGQARFPVPMEVLDLPTLAANNWYQNQLPGKLEDFVEEAYRYSCDVYARALFMGDRLTPQEQENIAAELSLLTGFDKAWILANHLVLRGYATHVRPGYRISLYDGRIAVKAGPQGDPFGPYGGDDPLSTVVAVKLLRCYRGLLCPLLGVETEEDYVVTSPILRQWDFRTPQPVANMQEALMASNHDLRILYCAGYYDALTPIGYLRYLLSHFNFPKEQITVRYYESGHMPYFGAASAKTLGDDLRAFLTHS